MTKTIKRVKKTLGVTLEIDGKFGSEFQRKSAEETLKLMLLSWIQFYQSRHKQTHIDIYDGGGNAYIVELPRP